MHIRYLTFLWLLGACTGPWQPEAPPPHTIGFLNPLGSAQILSPSDTLIQRLRARLGEDLIVGTVDTTSLNLEYNSMTKIGYLYFEQATPTDTIISAVRVKEQDGFLYPNGLYDTCTGLLCGPCAFVYFEDGTITGCRCVDISSEGFCHHHLRFVPTAKAIERLKLPQLR